MPPKALPLQVTRPCGPRQGTVQWSLMLPLLPPEGHFCPSPASSRPCKLSRAARVPAGVPTLHQPGHLESLPAFVLPAASSPDEESSSSDSSDCRSSTMERRGPGEGGKEVGRD